MSSIALFPCAFTQGETVIDHLATRLELTLYTDEDLIRETSVRFNCKPDVLQGMLYGRTSVFNQFTLEREKTVNMFRLILADKLGTEGQFLFYGHHAVLIPLAVVDVLTILLVDSKEGRIAQAQTEGLSEAAAKKQIKYHDVRAYRWAEFLFKKEPFDKSLYDLVLPNSLKSVEERCDGIINFFHKTSLLRSAESIQAVDNMALAAKVERRLLRGGHVLGVLADGRHITLSVEKSVFHFEGLKKELVEIVSAVRGVDMVTVHMSPAYSDSIYRQQKFELPSKVLFVDDEKEFVQTVAERLISRNVGTYGVFSGVEALELISDDPPDVMVLDLKMPQMHGVEVLKKAKELYPEIEIIILTGHGSVEDEMVCMTLGAFAYLNKPVDIETLSNTIKSAHRQFTENCLSKKKCVIEN